MSFHLFFYQECYWLSFLGCLRLSFTCKLSIKSWFKSLSKGGEMVQWWRHLPPHLESWGGSLGPTERKDRTNIMHFPLASPTTHTDKHIFSTLFLRHGWFLKKLGAHDSATKRATGSTCLWLLVGTCRCVPPCPVFYMGAGNKPLVPHASRLCQLPSPIIYGFQNAKASIISKYILATKKG